VCSVAVRYLYAKRGKRVGKGGRMVNEKEKGKEQRGEKKKRKWAMGQKKGEADDD
jgi:hypothetical protein